MRQNLLAWLIGILVLTFVAGYVAISDTICIFEACRDVRPKFGLDIRGGLQLVLQALPRGDQPINEGQLNAARNILEERANATGAAEPVVQTAGSDRILVELPDVHELEEATKIIQTTAFLEFINSGATPLAPGTLVWTKLGGPTPEQLRAGQGGDQTPVEPTAEITPTQTITDGATVTTTATTTGTTGTEPPAAGATPTPPPTIYDTVVSGEDIDGNGVGVDLTTGQPKVTFRLKGDGPGKMRDFTSRNIGMYMPIVLDKRVISSPVIQGIISDNGEISGSFTVDEARRLAIQLRYGALPVSLQLLESRKISATLGQEAIDRSVLAGGIGLGLVALFMIFYYRLPGALATLALLIYSTLVFAIFMLVPVTLTLAGIAGFILSIGMAVDANVLIFARLKEELRSGKTLGAAVEAGFDHAWPSIRDSNVSTLITCAILFWFGSTFGGASIIKGFSLTLAIGVLVSMFTAITITRTFLRAIVQTPLGKSAWAFNIERRGAAAAAEA